MAAQRAVMAVIAQAIAGQYENEADDRGLAIGRQVRLAKAGVAERPIVVAAHEPPGSKWIVESDACSKPETDKARRRSEACLAL